MVHDRTAGVPLFVRDLVSSWADIGAIRPTDDGGWTVSGALDALAQTVPPSAALLVEQGLDRLDEDDVETLEAAAVAGDEFSAAAVAAASNRPEEDVEARCATLARRGLFLRVSGERFSFVHPLHRQALYHRVTPRRRARYHGAVGVHLETVYGAHTDEHVGELAMHFDRAGDAARAVEYLRRAAEQAIVRGVHADAHGHLDAARHHVGRLPDGDTRLRAELSLELVRASAMIVTHRWGAPELAATYRRAAALCDRLGDPPERPVVTVGLATLDELCGRHEASAARVRPLLAAGSTPLLVETYELLACSAFHLAQFDQAVEYAEEGLSHYRLDEANEEYARHGVDCGVLCHGWAAFASWFRGSSADADRYIDGARAVTKGQPYAMATASITSAFFHQYRDEPDAVRHWAETTIALATDHGYPFRLAQGHALRGWARAVSGEADGLEELQAGVEAYAASGATIEVPYYQGLIADVLVRMGRGAEAVAHVDAALATIAVHPDYFYAPTLERLRSAAAG
jgi:tetratricopeptide (TPR) repeat protein